MGKAIGKGHRSSRRRYLKLKNSPLCVYCKEKPKYGSRLHCEECGEKAREYYRERYKKQKERKENG